MGGAVAAGATNRAAPQIAALRPRFAYRETSFGAGMDRAPRPPRTAHRQPAQPAPAYRVPATAASSAAMSILRMVIIASIARRALSGSGPVVSSISRRGVICHE